MVGRSLSKIKAPEKIKIAGWVHCLSFRKNGMLCYLTKMPGGTPILRDNQAKKRNGWEVCTKETMNIKFSLKCDSSHLQI